MPAKKRSGARMGVSVAIIAVLAVVAWIALRGGGETPAENEKPDARPMVVVLPFDNLGPPTDEYFADGVTEEITSHLASIAGLGVISRKSAMRYKASEKSLETIAAELGVEYILTGSIRWDHGAGSGRVRITPQLVHVDDDTSLWSDNYERALDRIFEVQSDIATEIARAMRVTLLEGEREVIEAIPTQNTEAYTYYLRGLEYVHRRTVTTTGNVHEAIAMFERAVELDQDFAEAWAMKGMLHANAHHNGVDSSPERLERARTAVERAVSLNPNSAIVNLCMGQYLYWGHKDYENALVWVGRAADIRPGDAQTLQTFGWINRRLGRYEEAEALLEQTLQLDPRDLSVMVGLVEISLYTGDLELARQRVERVAALFPDDAVSGYYLLLILRAQGESLDVERIRTFDPQDVPFMAYVYWQAYFELREYDRALQQLAETTIPMRADEYGLYPRSLLEGLTRLYRDGPTPARPYFERSLVVLDSMDVLRPDDHRIASARGYALAGLGRADEAADEGRRAVEMYPLSKDRYAGTWRLAELARILALAGKPDEALSVLEQLLSIPSVETVGSIRNDPLLDGVRQAEGYEELLRRFEPGS